MSAATTSLGSCTSPSLGPIGCTLGTLAASATATITIPITFTDVGQWTNSVSVSANEPDPNGSDNSASLNFDVAQGPDFIVSPATSSFVMQWGSAGNDVLTFTSLGGFSNVVSLACSVSGPTPLPSCSMSPSTVTPGANPVAATLKLTAPAFTAGLLPSNQGVLSGALYSAWLPLPGIVFIGIGVASTKSRQRKRLGWLLCSLTLALAALQGACGGGSSFKPPPPTQSYTVTITASSGVLSKSTQILVTVK
jgi:hypothetical protein